MIPLSRAPIQEKYVMTQELPTGFFGPTFLVHPRTPEYQEDSPEVINDPNLPILVCKVCHKSFIGTQEKVQSFLQRIHKLNELKLPFIVPFTDIIETNDDIFLFRAYLDIGNLTDFSHVTPNISNDTLIHIWRLLAERFLVLNQNGIFPSSVKPSNIFIDTENSILITDLYELTSDVSWALQTPDPMHLAFLAPEFFDRNIEPSSYSDVWSLGVIIVFLKFRQLPWTTKNVCAMIKMITSGQLTIPLADESDVSNIIRTVLIHEANKRPPTDILCDFRRIRSMAKKERRQSIPAPAPRFNSSARDFVKKTPLKNSVFMKYGIVTLPNSERIMRRPSPPNPTTSSVCTIRCRFINSSSGNL
ncbi:CAMK family protein kinase [Tritrichomonas foetus]|uniref:CAMK family protein kinase n=1 Tax=Tritrichomonas foetus TaxID=1144522 RepID=A0A1J4KF45_9EUKA|nr:CAMK family protein kinase [Tritrichomonas foetus]|eukprot:OHT08388.1 CAMK family protein kinase [Tritrichomonas foetus]